MQMLEEEGGKGDFLFALVQPDSIQFVSLNKVELKLAP